VDAERRPVISGVATGPDGPVALARVMIVAAPAPMPDLAGLTGEDGTFTMGTNGAGRYVIAVHADGFVPARVEVTVGPDDASADLRVKLVPEETPPRGGRPS
jgi:hypothetical protein